MSDPQKKIGNFLTTEGHRNDTEGELARGVAETRRRRKNEEGNIAPFWLLKTQRLLFLTLLNLLLHLSFLINLHGIAICFLA